MSKYSNTLYGATPQTEKQFGKNQVQNNAGGYVYEADPWTVLNRFLILGTENRTFYSSARELTVENATNVLNLIKQDGKRVVDTVVEISDAGRAVKNNTAIFVLAMCAAFGSDDTRHYAYANLNKVARIGTHLFQFVEDSNKMRGWGRGLRTAVGKWYTDKTTDTLSYQVMKYKNRENWSHKDVLKLAHPKPKNDDQNYIFKTITNGFESDKVDQNLEKYYIGMNFASIVNGNVDKAVELIKKYEFPREIIPTDMSSNPKIWMALLDADMPMTAMLRNLGNMSKSGILSAFSNAEKIVIKTLTDAEHIHKSRIHPLSVLVAWKTYTSGEGIRGKSTWDVNTRVSAALEDMFYLSFKNTVPTGLRYLNSIDVSGSMDSGIDSHPYLKSSEVMACMMMNLVKNEPNVLTGLFETNYNLTTINKNSNLTEVTRQFQSPQWAGTDCAQPVLFALKNKMPVDVFFIGSDGESWAGDIHTDQALDMYRQKMQIDAKLIVANTNVNRWSLTDDLNPKDNLSLNIAGFDAAWPQIINEFAKGNM